MLAPIPAKSVIGTAPWNCTPTASKVESSTKAPTSGRLPSVAACVSLTLPRKTAPPERSEKADPETPQPALPLKMPRALPPSWRKEQFAKVTLTEAVTCSAGGVMTSTNGVGGEPVPSAAALSVCWHGGNAAAAAAAVVAAAAAATAPAAAAAAASSAAAVIDAATGDAALPATHGE